MVTCVFLIFFFSCVLFNILFVLLSLVGMTFIPYLTSWYRKWRGLYPFWTDQAFTHTHIHSVSFLCLHVQTISLCELSCTSVKCCMLRGTYILCVRVLVFLYNIFFDITGIAGEGSTFCARCTGMNCTTLTTYVFRLMHIAKAPFYGAQRL